MRLPFEFRLGWTGGHARSTLVERWNDGGRDAGDVALAVGVIEEQETAQSAVRIANEPVQSFSLPQGVGRGDTDGSRFSRLNRIGGVEAHSLRSDQRVRFAFARRADARVKKTHIGRREFSDLDRLVRRVVDLRDDSQ